MPDFIQRDESPDAKPESAQASQTETEHLPLATLSSTVGDADEEDVESKLAYDSLMRHRKQRRRKKIIRAAIIVGIVAGVGITWWLSQKPGDGSVTGSSIPTATVSARTSKTRLRVRLRQARLVGGRNARGRWHHRPGLRAGGIRRQRRRHALHRQERQSRQGRQAGRDRTQDRQEHHKRVLYHLRNAYDAYYDGTGPEQAVYDTQSAYENAVLAQQTAQQNYDDAVAQAAKRTVTHPPQAAS